MIWNYNRAQNYILSGCSVSRLLCGVNAQKLHEIGSLRHFSKGAAKPTWDLPSNKMYQPTIPDRYFVMGPNNLNFSIRALELRALRPTIEKVLISIKDTLNPARKMLFYLISVFESHNPDGRLQITAFVFFILTLNALIIYDNQSNAKTFAEILEHLSLERARKLDLMGFWRSSSDEMEHRTNEYAIHHRKLNSLWEEAIDEATQLRSFDKLVDYLKVDESEVPDYIPEPLTMRFDLIPYGKDNPDTKLFPTPKQEKPIRSFALNFTYNNQLQSWGDYIDRHDNKMSLLRPSRPFFTDIYIPGTK